MVGERRLTYEYRRGPMCNRLKGALEDWVTASAHLEQRLVRRTISIDSALVSKDKGARAIFELKTSDSLGDQLYKAIGQLLCYRRKRGTPATHLALVLPCEANGNADAAEAFFKELGIHSLYETGPRIFKTSEGTDMESVLDSLLA